MLTAMKFAVQVTGLLFCALLVMSCDDDEVLVENTESATAVTDLAAAIREMDMTQLAAWETRSGATRSEVDLAQATLAAYGRDESVAIAGLMAATVDPTLSSELRRYAWLMIFNIRLRQNRYGDAVAAMDAALEIGADPNPARAAADLQGRGFAAALVDAPTMRIPALAESEIALTRDALGLPLANVVIDGIVQPAVFDTGASFPLLVQSRVDALGLRMLDTVAEGRTNSRDALSFRFAVADTLEIGGMLFEHVVFTVVPDATLIFGDDGYAIETIIGLPVLLHLGRLEFRVTDGVLRFGPSGHSPSSDSNLLLSGTRPLVLVDVADANERLQLMLDTGMNATSITDRAAAEFPRLAVGVRERTVAVGGVGGLSRERVGVIPDLVVSVHGLEVPLTGVWVRSVEIGGRHGILGQDVLSAYSGYVLDFQAMRFELLH